LIFESTSASKIGIAAPPDRPFSPDYAAYLQQFGRSIGDVFTASGPIASDPRYRHSIAVRPAIQRAITGERLDIVTERLADDAGFDLVVVTNVFPYFDDRQLALALTNIAAMLRPGGFLIHNESRPGLVDTAAAAKLPALHMRSVVIGGPCDRPFYDTVWLHRKN
jgi:SAM-dependent methyltransferase